MFLALALVASACGGGDAAVEDPDRRRGAEDRVAAALSWYVGVLDGHEPDGAEYEARFDASFRAEIGLAAFTGVTAQVRSLAAPGWRVESVEPSADGDRATAVLRSGAVPCRSRSRWRPSRHTGSRRSSSGLFHRWRQWGPSPS